MCSASTEMELSSENNKMLQSVKLEQGLSPYACACNSRLCALNRSSAHLQHEGTVTPKPCRRRRPDRANGCIWWSKVLPKKPRPGRWGSRPYSRAAERGPAEPCALSDRRHAPMIYY